MLSGWQASKTTGTDAANRIPGKRPLKEDEPTPDIPPCPDHLSPERKA